MWQLIALIALIALALSFAGYALLADRQRRTVMDRALTGGATWNIPSSARSGILTADATRDARLAAWAQYLPQSWVSDERIQSKLVQGGYESPTAPLWFATARVMCLVIIPGLVYLAVPAATTMSLIMWVGGSILGAWFAPTAYVDRKIRLRQERIRRGTPDALDLMVVCVEAGVSLDAAILRVARELAIVHPDIAHEYMVVNRKVNAGVTRDQALKGLWERTGVEDLRALVSSMVQSEKWGTSISKVLRVAADTLRRKRRQAAEKKAAMAPLKMTIPLVLLILPSMFIVIMGPVALRIAEVLKS